MQRLPYSPAMQSIFGATPRGLFSQPTDIKRVAAYCRVSTAMDTQAASLETQMTVFRQRILERQGWTLVDIYADDGLSGTSVRKRKEFMRMMADCEAGKIDYIITKSISRFARNTLECLSCIRYLQGLGIQLLFEKENIDTGSNLSEMILTVMAAFAQEESRSISANVTWGIRKQFEAGRCRWTNCYGFRKGPDGRMVIHPQEGDAIRQIFRLYEHGASLREVAATMNGSGLLTARGNPWNDRSIREILRNEKYMGDILLQKTYTIDHLSHRKARNNGDVLPRYHLKNHHEGIISADTFNRVQKISAMKNKNGGKAPQYPYGETDIRCPLCGGQLVQRNTHGSAAGRLVLGCFTPAGCCQFAVRKHLLNRALLDAYNALPRQQWPHQPHDPACHAAIGRLQCIQQEQPTMTTVEFYWLDQLVQKITFNNHGTANRWSVMIHWHFGLTTSMPLHLGRSENNPMVIAQLYRQQRNNQLLMQEERT